MAETTIASRPAELKLSPEKLRRIRPWFYGWRGVLIALNNFISGPLTGSIKTITRHLDIGNAEAALLLQLEPALAAAYSEDHDAVVLLTYPPGSVDTTGLKVGGKLVTVNLFNHGPADEDLLPGPRAQSPWVDFMPLIGNFISDDQARLDQLRKSIPQRDYDRCAELARDYQQRHPAHARDGRPGFGGFRKRYQPAVEGA